MTVDQYLAIGIFSVMFVCIMLEKWPRYISALAGALLSLLLVFRTPESGLWALNFEEIFKGSFWIVKSTHGVISHGINWQTIIFIAGMMIMIEGLEQVGFFRWLCLLVAKIVKYRVIPIFIAFFLLSGFLAMFIDSITVLLFLSSVTIELARLLEFDPIPLIIAEIFAANTGGSATMCGDPPNIIIGTCFQFSFFDFLMNTGLIAWICMLIILVYFVVIFRKNLTARPAKDIQHIEPRQAIKHWLKFLASAFVFLFVIILLITHSFTGISVALIGCIAALLILAVALKDCLAIIRKFDWHTILFFVGLFICVAGLEHTGILRLVADLITTVSGGNAFYTVSLILWISAFASAIVDNIPFAATMVPVILNLSKMGMPLPTLSWALALGADIGGNGTPIGASANVVGIARAEEEGYKVGWARYCKYALPAMILVIFLCNVFIYLRYFK